MSSHLGPLMRVGLFLCGFSDPRMMSETVSRISLDVEEAFTEIVVMLDAPSRSVESHLEQWPGTRPRNLRFHRPPRSAGFGALRKNAFEYALMNRFDQVLILPAAVANAPERIPQLLRLAAEDPARVVFATQSASLAVGREERLSHRISTFIQNRILGMQLADYQSRLRLYPADALARIPFQLGSEDARFDVEVVLQLRALGVPIHEDAGDEPALAEDAAIAAPPNAGSIRDDWHACTTAIGYRLHQAHVTRDGRYLVDHDVHYTLKQSETGSHMQVVSAIAPKSDVLDLGCSTGLLARLLQEKGVRVTGVDEGPGRQLAKELSEYYQRDLELPLELPYERIFDYVVCADVIEHLKNRQQLLLGARRFLKPGGKLVISTPNVALWFYRLSLLVGRFEYGPRGVLDETHVHLYTGATFRREVEKAGFEIVKTRVTALPFEVVFESTGRSRFVRGLAATYHALARLWPSMFAYQYVLEARITTLDEEATLDALDAP